MRIEVTPEEFQAIVGPNYGNDELFVVIRTNHVHFWSLFWEWSLNENT